MALFKDSRTEEQKKEFKIAAQSGRVRELAIAKGGTGHLRKELIDKEAHKLLQRKRAAKQARKVNR